MMAATIVSRDFVRKFCFVCNFSDRLKYIDEWRYERRARAHVRSMFFVDARRRVFTVYLRVSGELALARGQQKSSSSTFFVLRKPFARARRHLCLPRAAGFVSLRARG